MGSARLLAIPLLIVGMAPAIVRADPVQVTNGALTFDTVALILDATGERGLDIFAAIHTIAGGTQDAIEFCYIDSCEPGEPLSLKVEKTGDSSGIVSFDGETFSLGQSEDDGLLNVLFEGSLLAPPYTGEPTATATAPFQFTGLILLPVVTGPLRPPVPIFGSGLATLQFAWPHPDNPAAWQLRSFRYEFSEAAPVPEPTSVLLVGTGVAGAILRGRRRAWLSRSKDDVGRTTRSAL